jgi:hypothetical protein
VERRVVSFSVHAAAAGDGVCFPAPVLGRGVRGDFRSNADEEPMPDTRAATSTGNGRCPATTSMPWLRGGLVSGLAWDWAKKAATRKDRAML